MKFRPCIDLHDGVVKQIVGSTLSANGSSDEASRSILKTNFVSKETSEHYARIYKENNLTGGHIIMLGPNNEEAAFKALAAYPKGMQIGGGITPKNAKQYIDAGASHVIVTSYIFDKDGEFRIERLQELLTVVDKTHLVLDLSCRKKQKSPPTAVTKDVNKDDDDDDDYYYVVVEKWQKYTNFKITKENLEMLSKYCDEFLIHGVEVEGKRQGILSDLVSLLGEISPIPVTYAGGVKSLEDFELVQSLGNHRVDLSVGSALDIFGGDLEFSKVVEWHNNSNNNNSSKKRKI